MVEGIFIMAEVNLVDAGFMVIGFHTEPRGRSTPTPQGRGFHL